MGCNCKKDSNGVKAEKSPNKKKEPIVIKSIILVTKTILFLIGSLITSLIIVPFSIYLLFKIIFLDEGVDVTDSLKSIGKILKKKDKDEEDDEEEYSFDDEDELVLLDSE
tara:strand:- start:215 stop:544 length:330 start_codon:yes stop_codon:yes gene_type:complete